MNYTLEELINYIYIHGLNNTTRPHYNKVITRIIEELKTSCKKSNDKSSSINKKLVETLGTYNALNALFIYRYIRNCRKKS